MTTIDNTTLTNNKVIILIKLYKVKEGTLSEIGKMLEMKSTVYNNRVWLIENKIIEFIHFKNSSFNTPIYKVNYKIIDSFLLNQNEETRILWDRSHEYLLRMNFKKV